MSRPPPVVLKKYKMSIPTAIFLATIQGLMNQRPTGMPSPVYSSSSKSPYPEDNAKRARTKTKDEIIEELLGMDSREIQMLPRKNGPSGIKYRPPPPRPPRSRKKRKAGKSKGKKRMPVKRRTKRKARKSFYSGVSIQSEQAGISSSSRVQCLGHTSIAALNARIIAWAAVIKRILQKIGFNPNSLDQTIPIFAVTDKFILSWRFHDQSVVTTTPDDITTVGNSVLAIATFYASGNRPWNSDTSATSNQRIYERLIFEPTETNPKAAAASVQFQGSKVSVYGLSKLKFQNRTLENVSDDMADVNHVPLEMYSWSGNGQGPQWKKEQSAGNTFIADITTGLIYSEDVNLRKVPDVKEFMRVKSSKKLLLPVGGLKLSNVSSTHTMEFSRFMNALMPQGTGITFKLRYDQIGKYKTHMLERLIDPQGTGTISCAYEITNLMKSTFVEAKAKQTMGLYSVPLIANL